MLGFLFSLAPGFFLCPLPLFFLQPQTLGFGLSLALFFLCLAAGLFLSFNSGSFFFGQPSGLGFPSFLLLDICPDSGGFLLTTLAIFFFRLLARFLFFLGFQPGRFFRLLPLFLFPG